MLTQENLEKIGSLPSESSIMSKFLQDNKIENESVAEEIEKCMPFAMLHYNEEAKTPYLFRRISSTSTVKSVYLSSSQSNSSSQGSVRHELQQMMEDRPSKTIFYNILVAGDSGLGKTSFINTYMYLKFNYFQKFSDCSDIVPTTTEITHTKAKRTEDKIDFNIDMIDTPGYGSFRNINSWVRFIVRYLIEKIIKYNRDPNKIDERVHCCLYFIDSVLKQNDITALRELQKYMPIIPIISKADTCTLDEIKKFKKIILDQLKESEISIFYYKPEDNQGKGLNDFSSNLGDGPPYCVISAVSRINTEGKYLFGRQYNWGSCDINNPFHSDFPIINKCLIGRFYNQVKKIAKDRCMEIMLEWTEFQNKRNTKKQKMLEDKKYEKAKKISKILSAFAMSALGLFVR